MSRGEPPRGDQWKTVLSMTDALSYIPGQERVEQAVIDMCGPFKEFIKNFFPNAITIAERFHVLRLLNLAINKARTEITGDKRSNPVRRILLRNRHKLRYYESSGWICGLHNNPSSKSIYLLIEALHKLSQTRGLQKATEAFVRLTDQMAKSSLRK